MKKTILISVFNKDGVVEFAQRLIALGWDILASGGTATKLADAGIPVTNIATMVGDPILNHRVVTLSREIHAGLLARDNAEDRAELKRLNIPFIDAVYCNFYPLVEAISKPAATYESVIEATDIGGPTMVRSAAKGGRYVLTTLKDTQLFIKYLERGEDDNLEATFSIKRVMASEAEYMVAKYCAASAAYLSEGRLLIGFPTE